MRPQFSKLFAGITALLLCVSVQVFAQPAKMNRTAIAQPAKMNRTEIAQVAKANRTAISPDDQKAITALFTDVDKSKYRLQFNNGQEAVGAKRVSMADLKQGKKVTNPGEAAGYVVLVTEGNDVVYVLAVGKKDLTTVLGEERAAKLSAIMSKYAR